MYLGLDIASVNAGIALLSASHTRKVLTCGLIKTPESYKSSDTTKALYQLSEIKNLLLQYGKPKAIAVEAPAIGSANLAVSIGFIHGAVIISLLKLKVPVVYIQPTKWHWALLKHGRADKSASKSFAEEHFLIPKRIDHNQADAINLAYLGYCFDCYLHNKEPEYIEGLEERIKEIFFNPKPSKQPAGIMHRPDEFYFLP